MNPSRPITPFRLASLLRLQKDPKLALQLFKNPNPKTPSKPFRYSLLSYDLIITKLGRAKMFNEMQEILAQLKEETLLIPKEALFCDIINFYGRARLPENALKLLDELPSFRVQRTVKSYNSLLSVFLMCKDFDKMRELFVGIEKLGKADACTYNLLIRGFCASGRLDDASKVFDEMTNRGVSPNVITFGNLIYGFCLHLRLKEAFKLKTDMVKVYRVYPNAYIYASLIKGVCKNGELSLAFRLKKEMIRNKIELDPAIYSTLISGLFKAGRKEEALGVWEDMKERGYKPDTVTYNVIINLFCKDKDFEAAYRLLDEMVEKGCKPDVISYNVILRELFEEGKRGEANDLFEDMPRRGCAPDVVSYRILFDGFCNGMQFKEAAFILDEMIFKGFVPCSASICKFVNRLCEGKNEDLLRSAFNTLEKGKLVNVDLWRMAVAMVFKDDKLSSSFNLVDSLIDVMN
jgi:pentatricopeptide repeat protein